jgi:hypothetical protein
MRDKRLAAIARKRFRLFAFQFRANQELAQLGVPPNLQHIWTATNLAIFYIGLLASGRFIDGRFVPLTAGGALEPGDHI